MNQLQFVDWMRSVAPHIHVLRGKTAVIAFAGELIEAGILSQFAQDVSLLNALGMRIVLVHGFRPQIEAQLKTKGHESRKSHGLRITDSVALDCAQEAAGQLRIEIEAAFSQGMPNTAMAHANIRLVSGNFVTAKPVGIVDGVDFLHTGLVRKVDQAGLKRLLDTKAMVLLSPFGFSPTGESFNLSMEDVACSVASALAVDKLMFVTEVEGIQDANGLQREMSLQDAQSLLQSLPNPTQPTDAAFYLQHAVRACESGVERAHILPFRLDGSVLLEVFTHDGVGTMITSENLEHLRQATIDDVAGILKLIEPLERQGVLVKRSRNDIERDIANFTVIEHDGVIFGCAILIPFAEQGTGELACLTVADEVQGHGDGERILKRIEQRARQLGLTQLFVLTTRTMHWFIKRGFLPASVESLPKTRQSNYNWDRKSQVLVKKLS